MHLNPNVLRAFVDGELTAQRTVQVEQHLSCCTSCRQQLEQLQTRSRQVAVHLDAVAPGMEEMSHSPQVEFPHLTRTTYKSYSRKENFQIMFQRKPIWTAVAIIAALAIALSLTPVRAWASDFLSLFRLEKITVIQFDPQAANQASEDLVGLQETASNILEQNLTVTQDGDMREVSSIEEAASAAGFTPRIPAGMTNVNLAFMPETRTTFEIDRPQLQAILDALEVDVQLPQEVNGKIITGFVPAGIIAATGCDATQVHSNLPQDCSVLIQMPSPSIDAPQGLDVEKLGTALLQMLGFSPDEAAQLSRRTDWTSTLILPIPKEGNIGVYDLAVDGVTGTLLIAEDQGFYALLWVKDGMLYMLRGPGWTTEAQSLANTMP